MAWEVFSKSEVLPKWQGKWKYNNYAREYAKWSCYEYDTQWLFSLKNRKLHKKLLGYERTKSLFVYFIDKHGKKRLLQDVLKVAYRR